MKKNTKRIIAYVITLLIAALLPRVMNNNYYLTVMIRTLINCVVVLGLNFITGLTGQMNLGTAGIFAIGSYTSAMLCTKLNVSPWLGLVAAGAMGLLIGVGLGYPSLRVKGVYLSLTTIGFSQIVRMLLSNMEFAGGTQGIRGIPPYSLFGLAFKSKASVYYLFLVMTVVAFIVSSRIVHSRWGRIFKSLRDNADAVEMSGVNIADIKIKAFTLAAVFGCIGGAMYAHFMGTINPSSYTMDMSTNFVIMMMVGGIGSVYGNIAGAIIVTLLPELLRSLGDYYQLVLNVIILTAAIFFPRGWLDAFRQLFMLLKRTVVTLLTRKAGTSHE